MIDELRSIRDKEGKILDTSEILNMTGVKDLKEMENAREKLAKKEVDNPDDHQLILNRQILEIKIDKKKKLVKESQQQRKAARSHRQGIIKKSMKSTWKDLPKQSIDAKAQSLKNSQLLAKNFKDYKDTIDQEMTDKYKSSTAPQFTGMS